MRVASDRDRIAQLRELIAYHDRLYYEHDEPELPDAEYDILMREGTTFYCPARHPRSFTDTTSVQLHAVQQEPEASRQDVAFWQKRTRSEH